MASGYHIGQHSSTGRKWKNGTHFWSFDYGSQRDPETQRWQKKVPGPFVHNPFPQVTEKKGQSALTFSPQIEELGPGDRRTHALIVIGHWLVPSCGHWLLGCVYTGPVTQAGTLDVKRNFGDMDFRAHTQFPCSHYALCSSPWGHLPAGGLDISKEVVTTEAGNGS